MPHPRLSGDEIDRRAQALYGEKIRRRVDTPDNQGKVVVIDIDTGGYEIDDDPMIATDRALAKHPGAALFALRIGDEAVDSFGAGPAVVKQ